ncbi:MAG: aspartate aminotransferase family protein [Gemmatimonadetes bacterium]|nr:aspartate aminotransferase family protein [Gemmatimonadota bacterium]
MPRITVPPPGPRSQDLSRRLRRVESRNVTFVGDDFPVFWEEARGANVRDVDGNVYLDLASAFGGAFAGHAHQRIAAAIAEQAARLAHGMGDVHPPLPKVALLERLAALAPWPDARAVLGSSGSEAVEIALKTAHLATDRAGVLAFAGGYHGLTLGALAATDRALFRAPFEARLFAGVARAPYPTACADAAAMADALRFVEAALAERTASGDRIGAVLIEPIQGRGGIRLPAPGFLQGVAARARAAGALLVFDEVLTGFGRTGKVFAYEHEGVVPDLLCVGKALGGGLPVSACLGPARVMDAWPESGGEAIHTSTFLGHPIGCAAALAFLDVVETDGLVARAEQLGATLLAGLERGLAGVPGVLEVRGRGLLLGIELAPEGAAAVVAERALKHGLIVLPAGPRGEVLEIVPPATLTEPQLDHAVDALTELVRRWAAHA